MDGNRPGVSVLVAVTARFARNRQCCAIDNDLPGTSIRTIRNGDGRLFIFSQWVFDWLRPASAHVQSGVVVLARFDLAFR